MSAPKENSPLVDSAAKRPASIGEFSARREEINKTWRSILKEEGPLGWQDMLSVPHIRTSIITLDDFVHTPSLYYRESERNSQRRVRSRRHRFYVPNPGSFLTALSAICNTKLRAATVFGSSRLIFVMIFHLFLSGALAALYFFIPLRNSDFIAGIKDFVDICTTGIIFLLGGFVTMMMARWTAFRKDCLAGLHGALVNLSMYGATIWPTGKTAHREARALVTRYSIAAYHLLFLEARVSDYPHGIHESACPPTARPTARLTARRTARPTAHTTLPTALVAAPL